MKEITVTAAGDLVVTKAMLDEAGLSGALRLVIQQGEIHILPESAIAADEVVQELAGCLGQEPATAYDFHLKLGGLYEAR
jgi:hypothetical protein